MNIIWRLNNAYQSGGVKEIIRKGINRLFCKISNYATVSYVKKSKISYGLNEKKREIPIIISLTSFPERFPNIGLCLKSLLLQEMKPDRIIIFFGSDSKESDLTDEMIRFRQYGVEYRFDDKLNLMPHKKYFYAMRDFPDAIIITVDDDAIYSKDLVRSLYESYQKYPNAVSARRVHQIRVKDGKILPYNHWKDQCCDVKYPSMTLIATGVGGVLYPPGRFDKETFNVEIIQKLCLKADDLWLKCMEVRNNIPVVWAINNEVRPAEIKSVRNLFDGNVTNNNNDEILKNIMVHYSITVNDF